MILRKNSKTEPSMLNHTWNVGEMKTLDVLDIHLRKRAGELEGLKAEGHKIIGYYPGGYVPEEIILACDAVPVGLHRGGEHEPVQIAGAYLPRWIDTFCRAQIGFKVLGGEPAYDLVDLFVVPVTDNNVRILSDAWEFYRLGEIIKFGVPHRKTDRALAYYLNGINTLKDKLEAYTGQKVTDEKLNEAIRLGNRERALFRKISGMRKRAALPLTGRDFIRLLHASLWLDKRVMVEILEALIQETENLEPQPGTGPRILLTGSTLAHGDAKVIRLVEEAGANIVMEHFAEGLRNYWDDVALDGNPMEALTESYFRQRITPAWFRPSKEMRDFLIKLAENFAIDGVIWYSLMYRDSYTVQSTMFPKMLKQARGLPTLVIESDYGLEEVGALRTRVETFIEMIKG
jgi:benzoyl-CoA reductase/2-hydroxyglutaryl-CoA dehydratase subunit BcrC/BadD/HgdB